jgi:hypothetical protein
MMTELIDTGAPVVSRTEIEIAAPKWYGTCSLRSTVADLEPRGQIDVGASPSSSDPSSAGRQAPAQ